MSPKRPCRKSILETTQIREVICIFCKINDVSQNLCAAGTLHATSKKVNLKHAFSSTEKFNPLNASVALIYYHKSCYKIFLSRYQQIIYKKLNSDKEMMENSKKLVKAMRLSQIVNHVYDQKRYESISSFEVSALEKSYLNLLSNDNIIQTSHVSRFCDLLLDSIPAAKKRTINNKLFIIFSDDVEAVLSDDFIKPEDFVKLVNKVTYTEGNEKHKQ